MNMNYFSFYNKAKELLIDSLASLWFKGQAREQDIDIEITEKAKNLLATRGFTPKYGARQVAGTIRNYIRRPISKMIVAGTLAAGNTVVVDVADNGDIGWNVK